jgi:small subunit ribosomal protein S5e
MSSDGEVEVENVSGTPILPKEVTDEIGSVKLFNKWSYEDVEIRDISLTYGRPVSRDIACCLHRFAAAQR